MTRPNKELCYYIDQKFKEDPELNVEQEAFFSELALKVFDYIGSKIHEEGGFDCPSNCLKYTIEDWVFRAHEYWQVVRYYLRNEYDTDSNELAEIALIYNTASESKDKSWSGMMVEACKNELIKVFMPSQDMDKVIDEELIAKLKDTHESVLKVFFDTFAQLKVFHNTLEEYETEEERQLYIRLMSAYSIIMHTN